MNIVNDEIITNLFYYNDKIIPQRLRDSFLNKRLDIKKYIIERFIDSESYKESLFRIKNKIEIRPVCKICNKHLKFNNRFSQYCSNTCICNDINVLEKRKITQFNKYGNLYSRTFIGKNRNKNTCLLKYGYENQLQSPIIKEKQQLTNFKKYGVNYYFKSDECKLKSKQTCLEKYGVPFYSQTNEFQKKFCNTKKKNNSFNKSKQEDKLYEILCLKYGAKNVVRQYKSDLYPFLCDFYISNLDLYIEANFSWTHGKHPFDNRSEEDLNTLNSWKDKSTEINFKGKQKLYYLNAIQTWTIRDVEKRRIAKENNLNFVELWNIKNIN